MYTRCIDSNLESGRYISRVGRASSFLSLLPLDASVHQTQSRMPFYLKPASEMYLNLLADRIHVTSDRLHEREISSPCIQLEVNDVEECTLTQAFTR